MERVAASPTPMSPSPEMSIASAMRMTPFSMPASIPCLQSLCWSHVCTPERCVEEIRRVLDPSGPTGRDSARPVLLTSLVAKGSQPFRIARSSTCFAGCDKKSNRQSLRASSFRFVVAAFAPDRAGPRPAPRWQREASPRHAASALRRLLPGSPLRAGWAIARASPERPAGASRRA